MKKNLYKKAFAFSLLCLTIGVNAQRDVGAVPPPPMPEPQSRVRPGGGAGGTTEETPSQSIDKFLPVFVLMGLGMSGYYARKKQSKVA